MEMNMGVERSSELNGRSVEPLRANAGHIRNEIAGMNDYEAKKYLLDIIEQNLAMEKEGFGRVKDFLPEADLQSAQILCILWNARPRIKTYESISHEMWYFNGRYPEKTAINGIIKRLRRTLEGTDYPIEIKNHYSIGYNLSAPDGWQAPWSSQ